MAAIVTRTFLQDEGRQELGLCRRVQATYQGLHMGLHRISRSGFPARPPDSPARVNIGKQSQPGKADLLMHCKALQMGRNDVRPDTRDRVCCGRTSSPEFIVRAIRIIAFRTAESVD